MSTFKLTKLKNIRTKAVRAEYGVALKDCPEIYLNNFCNVGGAAEHLHLLDNIIGKNKSSVLVVGVFGGRDFWGLKSLGHDVVGLNLTSDLNCSPTFVGNVEDPWPFESESFDVIVMGEILEHLVKDTVALSHADRALKNSGKLLITVPFLHDEPDYHIRVHTPKTIHRTLEISGFKVDKYLERPGIPFMRFIHYSMNAVMLVSYYFLGKTYYKNSIYFLGGLEYYFAIRHRFIRSIFGKLRISNWGCLISASKTNLNKSYIQMNIEAFKEDA